MRTENYLLSQQFRSLAAFKALKRHNAVPVRFHDLKWKQTRLALFHKADHVVSDLERTPKTDRFERIAA